MAQGGSGLILTPDRRLRVFISSTLGDLAEERDAARAAIEEIRMHQVLFELGARPHPPRDLYRAYLAQSDIFVGIYWQSYGWIAPDTTISGLEDEFLLSEGMPRLMYLKQPAPERDPRLAAMLKRVANADVSYRKFSSAGELEKLIRDDLAILLTERFERSSERAAPSRSDPASPSLRTNVPLTANRLVGRSRDMREVEDLLTSPDVRLVTLTGPGGIGKSRLALELGASLRERFEDGAHFVSLESLTRPDEVPSAIAASLDLTERIGSADPADLVLRFLGERELLLILDNFEQLLEAGEFLARLLSACSRLKVLVTSRTVLKLRGESDYQVMPLDVPEEGDEPVSDAVELFLVRARHSPIIESLEQRQAVAAICRRLEGLPLAIELAAARTSILPPTAILERLDDRLEMLRGRLQDFPERQRTMRSAIAWSTDLLSEEDRRFFRRLAVFSGGFTLEAAEAITDPDERPEALDRLQTLIDSSLLQATELYGRPRMRMLEAIRRFALEQLEDAGEAEEFRRRHAEYLLRVMMEAGPQIRSEAQPEALDRLQAEDDNMRLAFRWLLDNGRAEEVAEAGWSIWPYWWIRGRLAEGRSVMAGVAESETEISARARARGKAGQGTMCLFIGEHGEAIYLLAHAAEELRAVGDKEGLGLVLTALGIASSIAEGAEAAITRLREAERLIREAGDEYALVLALNSLCWMLMILEVELPDDEIFHETVALTKKVGGTVDQGMAIGNYGRRLADADRVEGLRLLQRSLLMMIGIDMRSGASFMVDSIAELGTLDGEAQRAARLHGFARALRQEVGALPIPALEERRNRYLQMVRDRLGDDALRENLEIGGAYAHETGTSEALSLAQDLIAQHAAGVAS